MKKLEKIITEFRQALAKIYGDKLINLVLYGSQARGDATEDSDIDIMVILKSPVSPGDEIFRMGEVKMPISEEDFLCKDTPLLENIRREGIAL